MVQATTAERDADRPTTARTHFRRRGDYLAVVVIVVVAVAVSLTVWATSDIRHTVSDTAPQGAPVPPAAATVPGALRQAWQARSTATPIPVVVGPTVVSAAEGKVLGRDPATGTVRWTYARDLGLCTVSSAWSRVIALYHKSGGCSEVTTLDAATGARGPQRNGDAERGTRLVSDGTYVTTTGARLSDTWRSDLVQTVEYGRVPDFKIPDAQPRPDCGHGTLAASSGVVGVIERCPGEPRDRLTVYEAAPDDSSRPEIVFSVLLGVDRARLVTMTARRVAVATPTGLDVFDATNGDHLAGYPLDQAQPDLRGAPDGRVVPVTRSGAAIYWFTGSSTIALSPGDLHPLWTVNGTLGPGAVMAGKVLLPVPSGIAVTAPDSGARIRTIAVDRHGYRGSVAMDTIGTVVLEQRDDQLVALEGKR